MYIDLARTKSEASVYVFITYFRQLMNLGPAQSPYLTLEKDHMTFEKYKLESVIN